MDVNEQLVRDFYAARHRRDWEAVCALLTPTVVWRETGGTGDYAGDHRGRETVVELLEKFVEITGGTFTLEPIEIVCTAEHVAASVRWRAERHGTRVNGYDLAVFRITNGKIAAAWFFPDGYDPHALAEVFTFTTSG